MSTIVESIERRQLRDVPAFKAGDAVRVHFKVIEGSTGSASRSSRASASSGRVRVLPRDVHGSGKKTRSASVSSRRPSSLAEKIEKLKVAMIGDVNRAKLYYLRGRVGKKSRIRELRQSSRAGEKLRRASSPYDGVLLTVLATGCGGIEDIMTRCARAAIESIAKATGNYPEHVQCTDTPRPWLVEQTTVSICAVPRTPVAATLPRRGPFPTALGDP